MKIEELRVIYARLIETHKEIFLSFQESCKLLYDMASTHEQLLEFVWEIVRSQFNFSSSIMISKILDSKSCQPSVSMSQPLEMSERQRDMDVFSEMMATENMQRMDKTSFSPAFPSYAENDVFSRTKKALSEEESFRKIENDKVIQLVEVKRQCLNKLLLMQYEPQEKSLLIKAIQKIDYPIFVRFDNHGLMLLTKEQATSSNPTCFPKDLPGNNIYAAMDMYYQLSDCMDKLIKTQKFIENGIALYIFLIQDLNRYMSFHQLQESTSQRSNLLHAYVCSAATAIYEKTQENRASSVNNALLSQFSGIMSLSRDYSEGSKNIIPEILESISLFQSGQINRFLNDIQQPAENLFEGPLKPGDITEQELFFTMTDSAAVCNEPVIENIEMVHENLRRFNVFAEQSNLEVHRDIIENRHRSPNDQREYDERFGLTVMGV